MQLVWQYKDASFQAFRDALSKTNVEECFLTDDIDEACAKLTKMVLDVSKSHVPNKQVTVRPKDSPWYINKLQTMK